MRVALLLALSLLLVAAPIAVPSAQASVCTSNLDLARVCVNGPNSSCPIQVKFGGGYFSLG